MVNSNIPRLLAIGLGIIVIEATNLLPTAIAENWPQFRGSNVDGVTSSDCATSWTVGDGDSENVLWKVSVEGEGWSSPIVWGEKVFLTAAVPELADPSKSKPENYTGGGGSRRDDLTKTVFRYEVVCLNADTGETVWTAVAKKQRPSVPRHSSNTYATESPVTDGKRVYAYFGMNGLFCFDMDGHPLWEKDLGSFSMRAGWGTSSSPILFDDKLFVQVDNEEQSFLVALDSETGDEIWRVDRDEKSQYSTPIIWQNSLRNELIVGGMVYRSYDPKSGDELWHLDMEKGRSVATPIAVGDQLFVGTELRNRGGADDGGGFLFSVKPGGSDDITPPYDRDRGEFINWKVDHSNIQMASPAYADGCLYFLERRSASVHCVNAATGELEYRKRISGARAFWASPLVSNDRVYCFDSSGTTFVLSAGPEYELISRNPINEQVWSTPAANDGKIYLRTADHLYCIAAH